MITPNLFVFHRRCFLLNWVVFDNQDEILKEACFCCGYIAISIVLKTRF